MNKTFVIAASTSVVSLAVGGAAGYFLAYKKLEHLAQVALDQEIDHRAEAAREFYEEKYRTKYENLAKKEKVGPYATPTDAVKELVPEKADANSEKPTDPARVNGVEKVDYTKFAKTDVRHTDEDSAADPVVREVRPVPRPRDDYGRFAKQHGVEEKTITDDAGEEDTGEDVVLITDAEYVENQFNFDQYRFVWYHEHDVLMDPETEEQVDLGRVGGEKMMENFDFSLPEDADNEICVRNVKLEEEYVITLSHADLNDEMDALQD